jgi:hypothetical protein
MAQGEDLVVVSVETLPFQLSHCSSMARKLQPETVSCSLGGGSAAVTLRLQRTVPGTMRQLVRVFIAPPPFDAGSRECFAQNAGRATT